MKKLDLKTVPKLKPNPLFKGMRATLKDPANFEAVERRLMLSLRSGHDHKTVSAYVKCVECQQKREERKTLMKKEGFKSMAQYMEWKKIHTIIKDKKNFQIQ